MQFSFRNQIFCYHFYHVCACVCETIPYFAWTKLERESFLIHMYMFSSLWCPCVIAIAYPNKFDIVIQEFAALCWNVVLCLYGQCCCGEGDSLWGPTNKHNWVLFFFFHFGTFCVCVCGKLIFKCDDDDYTRTPTICTNTIIYLLECVHLHSGSISVFLMWKNSRTQFFHYNTPNPMNAILLLNWTELKKKSNGRFIQPASSRAAENGDSFVRWWWPTKERRTTRRETRRRWQQARQLFCWSWSEIEMYMCEKCTQASSVHDLTDGGNVQWLTFLVQYLRRGEMYSDGVMKS